MRTTTGLRIGAAAVGALSALAFLPGGASAAFDGAHAAPCANAVSIAGRGASFQRQAQLAWGATLLAPDPGAAETNGFGYATSPQGGCAAFKLAGDGGTAKVTYEPRGSGDGRKAVGASTVAAEAGLRDTNIQFAGADEPPNAGQLTAANSGPDHAAGTADDAVLHTIPVAQSSVAVVAKLPAGCTVTATAGTRRISRAALEGAFAGKTGFTTWGDVVPAIAGAGCATKPVQRVVRLDSSGTTFAFKRYLTSINATDFPASLGNTAWPNDAGATAVVRGTANGVGPLLDRLSGLADGGIGYADLAAARDRGYSWGTTTSGGVTSPNDADDTFWLAVERKDGAYQSPALGDQAGTANPGSNCRAVSYSDPATGKLPATTESWANVDGTGTLADYPLCALTYALAWEDLAKANVGHTVGSGYNQGQARAVRDYLGYALNVNGGQAALAPNGYQGLPSIDPSTGGASANSLLAVSQAAQAKLTWDKQPIVDPGPGGGEDPDPDPGQGGPGPGPGPGPFVPVITPGTPVPPGPKVVAPTVTAPSVALNKAAGVKRRGLALTVAPSAAGKVAVVATVGSGKKLVTVASGSATAKSAGALVLKLKPTSKGKKALKAGKSVKLTFKLTFTAADGQKATSTKTIKVKIKR